MVAEKIPVMNYDHNMYDCKRIDAAMTHGNEIMYQKKKLFFHFHARLPHI